jgi:hypothetical protein
MMSAMSHPTVEAPAGRYVRRAWWSLLLFPVSFAAAMLVGEGATAALGYSEPSLDSTPAWVIASAVGAAFVAFAAPLLVTARLSSKVAAAGEPGGRTPTLVAAMVVGAFVLANLASGLLQLLVLAYDRPLRRADPQPIGCRPESSFGVATGRKGDEATRVCRGAAVRSLRRPRRPAVFLGPRGSRPSGPQDWGLMSYSGALSSATLVM